MVGKIFITRSGYDPQLGKHVKDPYLGPNPTLGACRPDVRKQLTKGDHIFVISGKVPLAPQYVMAGFEIAAKIDGLTAYQQLPEHRLHVLPDGQLDGNIICGPDGRQHELDNHNSFENRMKNYVIGTNLLALTEDDEIERGRNQTLEALRDILHKNGCSPFKVVGRFGTKLDEKQILELRTWLASLPSMSPAINHEPPPGVAHYESGDAVSVGDLVQLRPGADPHWQTSLLLVCKIRPNGRISGVVLRPHRSGAKDAWYAYSPPEVVRVGRALFPPPEKAVNSASFLAKCPPCLSRDGGEPVPEPVIDPYCPTCHPSAAAAAEPKPKPIQRETRGRKKPVSGTG